MSPRWGSKPRRTDRLVVGRNVTLTLTVFLRTVRTFVNVEIITEDVEIGPYISW
jgi:hypothetical protein